MNEIKNIKILHSFVEETGKKEYIGAYVYYTDKEPELFVIQDVKELKDVYDKIITLVKEIQQKNASKSMKELESANLVKLYDNDHEPTLSALVAEFSKEKSLYSADLKSLNEEQVNKIVEEEKKEIEKKKSKKGIIATGILLGAVIVAAIWGTKSCEKTEENPVKVEAEDDKTDEEANYASYQDYLQNAPETEQKATAVKVYDFANKINASADWMTQKDEEGNVVLAENGQPVKWGVTEEETLAFYIYQNNLTEDEILTIYGDKTIDPEDMTELRNSFVQKMMYFYMNDKTGVSNVADLFNNETDKIAILKFEQLNARYNNAEIDDKEDIALELYQDFFDTYYDNSSEEYIGYNDDQTSMAYILSALTVEQQIMNSTSTKVTTKYTQKTTIDGEEAVLTDLLKNEIDAHCENFVERLDDYAENQEDLIDRNEELQDTNKIISEVNQILEKQDSKETIDATYNEVSEYNKLTEGTIGLDKVLGYIKEDLTANGKYPNGEYDRIVFVDFSSKTTQNVTGSSIKKSLGDKILYSGTDRDAALAAIGNNPALIASLEKQEKAIANQNVENKEVAVDKAADLSAIYDSIDNAAYSYYKANGASAGSFNYQQYLPAGVSSDVASTAASVYADAKARGIEAYNIVNTPKTGGEITDEPDTIPSTSEDTEKSVEVAPTLESTTPTTPIVEEPTPTAPAPTAPVAPIVESGVTGGEITYPTDSIPSTDEDIYIDMNTDIPAEEQSVNAQLEALFDEYWATEETVEETQTLVK